MAMEDVIEGGPWLFQGQPIVLQPWDHGMSLRRQKHTQIPVWIHLKHLSMEYWTNEGLSTVASCIGTPLYTDGITKDCSRLDFARVCVMLDFNSELPKHLVVISPVLQNGKEDPKRIDVEYEWLPQRCKNCCSDEHQAFRKPQSCMMFQYETDFPPMERYVDSAQKCSSKPYVQNNVVDTEGKLKPLTQAEEVLNWQTTNARAQNRSLTTLDAKMDRVLSRVQTTESKVEGMENHLQKIYDNLVQKIQQLDRDLRFLID
ncbi:polyprotein [Sesamum angolense]|uniref:Polyprotein n=1 Tax=Sesamum angolense TaxID=2727404 RepID=A0AAE1TB09_9LAMI|nr:polyprotein [Sesamum angolense]